MTHQCTCGGEIGPRDERCYFVQRFSPTLSRWVFVYNTPDTLDFCEHIVRNRQDQFDYRIVRRTDEVVREFGKGAK